MEVKLREIDRSTWEQCCDLRVSVPQREFVASNAYSLAQAAYEPDTYPMGIFCDGALVGFIMWDFDLETGGWELTRFMVDEKQQKKGIGEAALRELLNLVTKKRGHIMFYTSAHPDNAVAIGLYEKLGFRKNGRIAYDEVVLEKQL